MTLPDERTRAIYYTRLFLRSLLYPQESPKVPRYIRLRAGALLRHYPGVFDLERIIESSPRVLGPCAELKEDDLVFTISRTKSPAIKTGSKLINKTKKKTKR